MFFHTIFVYAKTMCLRLPPIPILVGRPDFQPMCPTSRHDPRRDVYVPIFWSKKLIVCLIDSGII